MFYSFKHQNLICMRSNFIKKYINLLIIVLGNFQAVKTYKHCSISVVFSRHLKDNYYENVKYVSKMSFSTIHSTENSNVVSQTFLEKNPILCNTQNARGKERIWIDLNVTFFLVLMCETYLEY